MLVGQCLRSNAGLYYEDAREFVAALDRILSDPALAATLGRTAATYFAQHYSWPVIERKYLDMFDELRRTPGRTAWNRCPAGFARRARTCPPAADVVHALPAGAVVESHVLGAPVKFAFITPRYGADIAAGPSTPAV